jgi:hypothetical protein
MPLTVARLFSVHPATIRSWYRLKEKVPFSRQDDRLKPGVRSLSGEDLRGESLRYFIVAKTLRAAQTAVSLPGREQLHKPLGSTTKIRQCHTAFPAM